MTNENNTDQADQATPDAEQVRFTEFMLADPLQRAIDDLGFEFPSPIQAESLPWALANYDVTGQAQTGTGKTAAFLISLITHQIEHPRTGPMPAGTPRALCLAPTRELALQIAADAEDLGKYTGTRVLAVVGGMDFDRQRQVLDNESVDILVATPGRLIDFIQRRVVNLRYVEQLVIDEADRMLDMGFIPDVRRIVYQTPKKHIRQTLFFSATFNDDVMRLAESWTRDPVHVRVSPADISVDTVKQRILLATDAQKFTLLYNLIQSQALTRTMVFANRRDQTRDIAERLSAYGIDCEMLSGDVPQNKRLSTLAKFKSGDLQVLVATDVAGRGIHVDDVSHVINYHLPEDAEDYVHRIGRTGRAGNDGIAISFASEEDAFQIPQIEELVGAKLQFEHPEEELLQELPEPLREIRKDDRRGGRSGSGGRPGGRPGGGGGRGGDRGRPRR